MTVKAVRDLRAFARHGGKAPGEVRVADVQLLRSAVQPRNPRVVTDAARELPQRGRQTAQARQRNQDPETRCLPPQPFYFFGFAKRLPSWLPSSATQMH